MAKKEVYELILKMATEVSPLQVFDTPDGEKGVYRLKNNIIRTLLVSEVERKRVELQIAKSNSSVEESAL